MNIKILIPARIEKGKLLFKDPVKLSKVISAFEGRDVVVSISPPRKEATDPERKYYWAVIIRVLCELTGYSKYEMHEILKALFLSAEKVIGGVTVKYSRSTEELSTIEKEQYHSDIREWASVELHVYIPLPNEVDY